MMDGNERPQVNYDAETLLARISHRLERLYNTMQQNRSKVEEEKAELQSLVSDISHQTKTPIANLKMLNDTLLSRPVSEEKRREFLTAAASQLNSIEQKQIDLFVDCSEDIMFAHDSRWTSEALFNLLDNAVKYTPSGGSIHVTVQEWEMYVKIDIADTDRGIPENAQATIFKRFYREESVHDVEGIGIGLYLAREIITMQGGYIKVVSEPGKGSTFSVFLPGR